MARPLQVARKMIAPEWRIADNRLMKDIAPLFRAWLGKRREIASVAPSSRWTVQAVCDKVSGDARQVIVEFGPGSGAITRGLLRDGVLSHDSRLILIESNDAMAAYLARNIRDQRVTVVHESAENVREILSRDGEEADAVISGIPYSSFDPDLRERIVSATADILKPGGTHVVYQVRSVIEPVLRQHFADVRQERVWPNIPPLHLYQATRGGISGSRTSA